MLHWINTHLILCTEGLWLCSHAHPKRLLEDRPDLNGLIDEGVGTYHIATPEEIEAQIARGPVEDK